MRRITLAVVITVAVLVLLFSYHTSLDSGRQSVAAPVLSGARVIGSSTLVAVPTAGPSTTGRSTPAGSGTSAPVARTVRGAEESTRYGIVQVQVTITAGQITEVQALEYPTRDPMDREINADAVPELRNRVLTAQSAKVQGVSGATFTSEGYLASVQSALDAAGFTS